MDPDDRHASAAGSVVEGETGALALWYIVYILERSFVSPFVVRLGKVGRTNFFLSGQILRILVHSCVFLCAALGYVEVGLALASNDGNSCRLGSGPMLAGLEDLSVKEPIVR